MQDLATVAPAFIEMAHRIVWASVATVDSQRPPTLAHPASHLAVGQRTADWLDRHQPHAGQTCPPGRPPLCVGQLLGAVARHLRGRVPGGADL